MLMPRRTCGRMAWSIAATLGALASPLGAQTPGSRPPRDSVAASEALVVTGTAVPARIRELGHTVSTIDVSQRIHRAPLANIDQLLQGRVPGVTLMPGAGTAGTAANIRTRGVRSLYGSSRPLFFVDGIRIASEFSSGLGVFGQSRNALDVISPEDVESVEVIKGPAAAALYGGEAASGVVQISTRKGRGDQPGVRWSIRAGKGREDWTLPHPTNYTLCDAPKIRTPSAWPGCAQIDSLSDPARRLLVDAPLARDPRALRAGDLDSYKLSVHGGGASHSYYLSGNHDAQEGVFVNNRLDRTTGRANITLVPRDSLEIALSVGYARVDVQLPLNDNARYGLLRNAYLGQPGSAAPYADGYLELGPVEANRYRNTSEDDRFLVGATVSFRPYRWLAHRLLLGVDNDSRHGRVVHPFGSPFAPSGSISVLAAEHRLWNAGYTTTISNALPRGFTSAFSGGVNRYSLRYEDVFSYGSGFAGPGNESLDGATTVETLESRQEWTSTGITVQEQVGWRDRLFLTAAVRFDKRTDLGEDTEQDAYPALSASYLISEESFFAVPFVDELRFRAAWGKAGAAPLATSSAPPAGFDRIGFLSNRSETVREIELGFDAGFFRGRAGLEVTYYDQRTLDALVLVALPPSGGFSQSMLQPIGEIANSGLELTLFGAPVQRRELIWDVRATLSTNRNEVAALGRDLPIILGFQGVQQHRQGYPAGAYWTRDVARDPAGRPLLDASGNALLAGDARFAGPSIPTREASFASTFTVFGNLRLYAFADYKGGHHLWSAREWRRSSRQQNSWEVNDPNGDPAMIAAYRAGATDLFIDNADFIKLREASLTYTLPVAWARKLRADAARVTLSGRNLAIWTRYDLGSDPELNFYGSETIPRADYMSVPMMRRLVASIDLDF